MLREIGLLPVKATHKIATPVEPQQGDDVIIAGTASDERAKTLWPDGWEAPRPYVRIVSQP